MNDEESPTLTEVMIAFAILGASLLMIMVVTFRALCFFGLEEYMLPAVLTICGVAVYWSVMLILGKRFRP